MANLLIRAIPETIEWKFGGSLRDIHPDDSSLTRVIDINAVPTYESVGENFSNVAFKNNGVAIEEPSQLYIAISPSSKGLSAKIRYFQTYRENPPCLDVKIDVDPIYFENLSVMLERAITTGLSLLFIVESDANTVGLPWTEWDVGIAPSKTISTFSFIRRINYPKI